MIRVLAPRYWGLAFAVWAVACGEDVDEGLAGLADAGAPDAIAPLDAEADARPPDAAAPDATSNEDATVGPDGGADAGPDAAPPTLTEVALSVEVPSDKPLQAVLRIEADAPVTARIDLEGPGVERTLQRDAFATEHEVFIVQLRELSTYTASVSVVSAQGQALSASTTFETGALALTSRMRVSVVRNDPRSEPGLTLFSLFGQFPEYVAVDKEGHIVWHWIDPTGSPQGLGLIIRLLDDGNLLVRTADGMRVIDAWGRTVRDYPERPEFGLPFHHDAIFVPDGNLLVQGAEVRQAFVPSLGGQVNVLADTVLELDPQGNAVRTWRAFDALDNTRFPGPMSVQDLSVGLDWSHANAIVPRARDDSYLVSVRNQSWVVKVDRLSGAVEWVLGEDGDFTLEEGTWFNAQHTPTWVGDELVIYDNGNELTPPRSRVVSYRLDEIARTAREVWSWPIPFYTSAVGDVDRLPNTWLITAGVANPPARPTLFEIDDQGEVVWQLEADRGAIYRAERIPGLSVP